MAEIILESNVISPYADRALPVPLPSVNVNIRPGVLTDVPFLDSLQKVHSKQVGWMPTAQFEGKIKLGHVLIAEAADSGERIADRTQDASERSAISDRLSASPLGYLIGNDQYFKRDDVGIIYQMNVVPGRQRGFIGATLLKAQFDRAAYGCKLFCCWCAQDIAANMFWEAMGFVALAYRAGSEKKSRVHIFWQKRIRSGDVTTPWWFPSKTSGGSIREDRIVLPILPGTHWRDAKALILPSDTETVKALPGSTDEIADELPDESAREPVDESADVPAKRVRRAKAKVEDTTAESIQPATITSGRLQFFGALPTMTVDAKTKNRVKQPKAKKAKHDPQLVAKARELRDKYLEQYNAMPPALSNGKYDVAREIDTSMQIEFVEPVKQLAA